MRGGMEFTVGLLSAMMLSNENEEMSEISLTCHCQDAHKEADITPGQHDGFGCSRSITALFPSGPDSGGQDHQIESGHSPNTSQVDSHDFGNRLLIRLLALDIVHRPPTSCYESFGGFWLHFHPKVNDSKPPDHARPSRIDPVPCVHRQVWRMRSDRPSESHVSGCRV
jgi:hypothetical protein